MSFEQLELTEIKSISERVAAIRSKVEELNLIDSQADLIPCVGLFNNGFVNFAKTPFNSFSKGR